MGYFSCGSELDVYEAIYCEKCVRCGDCSVHLAHIMYAHRLHDKEKHVGRKILNMLISLDVGGMNNEKCSMFYER